MRKADLLLVSEISLEVRRADTVGIPPPVRLATLHTIGMSSRLKFRIRPVMYVYTRWQTCQITRTGRGFQRPFPFVQPVLQAVQRAAHAVSRQRVDIIRFGLLEKLDHIGRRDSVIVQPRFESLQPECCQHQQPRNKRDEQPRHKGEVNTAKVSAGSRIATGPHRSRRTP
jgi:hypothetical protein